MFLGLFRWWLGQLRVWCEGHCHSPGTPCAKVIPSPGFFVPWGQGGHAGTASPVMRCHPLTRLGSVLLGLGACPVPLEQGEGSTEGPLSIIIPQL